MAFDLRTLEWILQRTEDNSLDFKVQQYKFDTNRQISGFIKDILTMANTPRNDSAYIVIGVAETEGRPSQVVGTREHIDPSEVDRKLQDKVNAVPSVEYHVIEYQGHEIGVYEIKIDHMGPFVPSKTFERLNPGAIHYRRNTQNVVATNREDIDRIVQWFRSREPLEEPQYVESPSWQQFHRLCDGFDERRTYICVIDESAHITDSDWVSFAKMGWDLIIDFDIHTDKSGAFFKSNEALGKIRSLKLTPLDSETPVIGPGASLWVAARGVSSRPTTLQEGSWREWHREKLIDLRKATEAVAKISDVKPATMIVFGGGPQLCPHRM